MKAATRQRARAAAVQKRLLALRELMGAGFVEQAELAWEAHQDALWQYMRRATGEPYPSEEVWLEEILSLRSWRAAARRLQIGKALAHLAPAERDKLRASLAAVGLTKVSILAPAIESCALEDDLEGIRLWIERAERLDIGPLQHEVSETLGRKRTRDEEGEDEAASEAGYDRDRIARYLIALMPDQDARALCERFLRVGARVSRSRSAIGILIAGMQEALGSWEPRFAAILEEP